MDRKLIGILAGLLLFTLIAEVSIAQSKKTAGAVRFATPPVIDGRGDDHVWQAAEPLGGFVQEVPVFGQPATVDTEVRIGFDEEALYVLFVCSDPEPQNLAASITKRDGDLHEDDAVAIMLDTFLDSSNSFYFATNSLGTQADGRFADNAQSRDSSWDATWKCATSRFDGGWVAEFAIPFRTMKFKAGHDVTWGMNLARTCPRRLERMHWNGPVESFWRVSQFGRLSGLDLAKYDKKRYRILPYVIFQAHRGEKSDRKIGLDFEYLLTSSVGLQATVNPDFALVEADVEQINLTRYELQIPEKRPFFQGGAELCKQRISQFYSRRIGDIPWGAKAAGKLGGFDLAVIGAQSDPAKTRGDAADQGEDASYTVLRLKRGLFGSSNIGFLAANRRRRGEDQGSVGLDATLFFTETLGLTAQIVRAHGPRDDGALAWFVRPAFDSSTTHFHVRYSNWDRGLMANMNTIGFVSDDDRKELDTNFSHTVWVRRAGIESFSTESNFNRYSSQAGVLRSWVLSFENSLRLANKWNFNVEIEEEFKRYEKDFRNSLTLIEAEYDTRTGRSFDIAYGFGVNYDSDMRLLEAGLSLKATDALSFRYSLTKLWLDPDPEQEATWIHVIRSDYYFHSDLFLKLFFQTNSVIDKKNVQAVLVWRFLPPFGALQLAYQHGTSRFGTASDQGHTLFTKLSWVF